MALCRKVDSACSCRVWRRRSCALALQPRFDRHANPPVRGASLYRAARRATTTELAPATLQCNKTYAARGIGAAVARGACSGRRVGQEFQGDAVDAVAQPGRLRAVLEHVAQMPA